MDKTSIKTASMQTGVLSSAPTPSPLPFPQPETRRAKPGLIKQILAPVASLRLTVILFVLALILVLAGTLAQIDHGIWTVVAKYFRAFFVWIPFQIFFPRAWHIHGGFPFVGGYIIGGALLVNLLAAHAVRFKLTWKRSGILILHSGLILLMLGELVTGLFAVEARMTIPEEEWRNFVELTEYFELAFLKTSPTDPKMDDVVVIPGKKLQNGAVLHDDKLPCDVVVEQYMRNAEVKPMQPGMNNPATEGDGLTAVAIEKNEASGVDQNAGLDMPSAYVTFKDKQTGKSLGTFLLSSEFYVYQDHPQKVTVDGTPYEVYLRFQRIYKPYTIHLNKFSHDLYDGTDIPKNYSSQIRLEDPSRGEDREVKIWMNHPLRYEGDTFYQADFLKGSQRGTILQVVRNPGWTMPYIACTLVALGMLIHFGLTLIGFIRTKAAPALMDRPTAKPLNGRRDAVTKPTVPTDWRTVGFVSFVLVAAVLYLLVAMTPPSEPANQFNYENAGKIAVIGNGRSKPLESFARGNLLTISGRTTFYDDKGVEHPATEWLFDVMTSQFSKNGKAESYKVFRIENDQVLNLLGLKEKSGFRYSIDELKAAEHIDRLQVEADRARQIDSKERRLFDVKVLELAEHIQLYIQLSHLETPLVIDPQTAGGQPQSLRDALEEMSQTKTNNPQVVAFTDMLDAYIKNDVPKFNSTVASYRATQEKKDPDRVAKAEYEAFFNHFAPFYQCMVLYVLIIVLASLSWLVFQKPLNRTAFWLMLLTWIVHTIALVSRMYIQGRPPVTNLYSSAVFIGWVAVGLLLVVEYLFKYGIATFLGGIIGFATLLIAHFLSLDGDTMEMLQAVLDTNFWLATHVTCVTIGYATTFVAGFLGMLYIIASIYNNSARTLDRNLFTDVASHMLYGVVCFAMFFSFTGTVLGGIWADQSWGRFWGWDPKENGALLIVIWNALILHARWAGLVKARGMAVLAVFGNIVTAWSWFGVNMLGVGLHSYGFMEGAAIVLGTWMVSQLGIMVLGMIPSLHEWQRASPDKDKLKAAAV